MGSSGTALAVDLLPEEESALQEVLGYLNFSQGTPDPRFQRHLNTLYRFLVPPAPAEQFPTLLTDRLKALRKTAAAFKDSRQAEAVTKLVFEIMLPAYQQHHADLLFHITADSVRQPFFIARVCEATLAQGGPWDEVDRIRAGALTQLNDFLGHRPVAVLENGRQMQPYSHERFRPLPIYLKDAGVAQGKYAEVVRRAIALLAETPADILQTACFDLSRMEELAVDIRAYDHSHPVYRRTNYTFGEWDPHCIDVRGYFRRFVIRSIILEALHEWMDQATKLPEEQKFYEASAVLAGTILMASAVSGSGPDTHDSTITLTSLLPRIARQRDAFYHRLLSSMTGPHAERLKKEAQEIQQPFGRIRQHLNLHLAHYGCRQLQRSQLAYLYARMGYSEAARQQAQIIPSTSVRFETEIQWRITASHLEVEAGRLDTCVASLGEIEALLHRGIECGALVDPWNILGFQGQFPLFQSREDSVSDQRVEKLLSLMEQIFALFSRVQCEASATGAFALGESIRVGFRRMAEFWDKFATYTVNDLPVVRGLESCDSAAQVSDVLQAWFKAGESAGDLAFWKKHVADFESAKAFAIVTEVLLRKQDVISAMGLLVQWLSQNDTAPLESGPYSFFSLVERWLYLVIRQKKLPLAVKFMDYLEVNAGEFATVPSLDDKLLLGSPPVKQEGATPPDYADDRGSDEEDSLFEAAYENVTYRDSAEDGQTGETMDTGSQKDSEFDHLLGPLELRIRFLIAQMRLWQSAAAAIAFPADETPEKERPHPESIVHWHRQCQNLQRGLDDLAQRLHTWEPSEPAGDPDSLMEYDRQLHIKFTLLNNVLHSQVSCREAIRVLASCQPAPKGKPKPSFFDEVVQIQRLILQGNALELRKRLPGFLKELAKKPLLYVPFDKGGSPKDILAARDLQMLLRMLLVRLPRLGLQRETWHVLRTAFYMERTAPPSGMSITEFDRLLQAGFRSALEALIHAEAHWPGRTDEQLVDVVRDLCEKYMRLWLKHSETMSLTRVEVLKDRETWKRTKDFIQKYGGDLFQAQVLTLSNMRAIVHRNVDAYLDYLEETQDPLHPIALLNDLDKTMPRDDAVFFLDLIFRCVVEKFDRFMEYNTTTTQSDYGEQLHSFLDFLRLEADYDREAWNLTPVVLAHEVLLREGRTAAGQLWYTDVERRTADMAKTPLQKLKKLEKLHGIRLPSISDRLNERFVKPLVLDRILALVEPAMHDARAQPPRTPSPAFDRLIAEVEQYLVTSSGSAMDLQPWLQSLSDEVQDVETEDESADISIAAGLSGPNAIPLTREELRSQLDSWEQGLGDPA